MELGYSYPSSFQKEILPNRPSAFERAEFFERTRALEVFRATDAARGLEEVNRHREQLLQPERSLWDAVELMMRDEVLRDQLLKMEQKGADVRSREEKEAYYLSYRSLIAGYRSLIELAHVSQEGALAEREIIPYTRIGHLRLRLADLLANSSFHFPDHEHALEDRREAFVRLSEVFYTPGQEGLHAEVAFVGLLRYGSEWLRGKEPEEGHLAPAVFVERTMPREDVLRPDYPGASKAGRFNGYDAIYRVPGEMNVRFVQLKTGKLQDKPLHVNLPALELIGAYERVAGSSWMRGGSSVPTVPGVADQSIYRNALQQTIAALPLDEGAREAMKRALLPRAVARRSEPPPPPAWTVSWQAVKFMLETDNDFRRFVQQQGMPLIADQRDFSRWSRFLLQARANQGGETFWKKWPKPKGSLKKTGTSLYS